GAPHLHPVRPGRHGDHAGAAGGHQLAADLVQPRDPTGVRLRPGRHVRLHALRAFPAWSFQTGAGANTTPTIFERDGKQYVAFYAGGNSLAASAHGDILWLFSLDGTMGPVLAPGAGAGVGHAGEAPTTPTNAGRGDAAAGEAVFADDCSVCHGADGR